MPHGTATFPPGKPKLLPSLLPSISRRTFERSSPHSTLNTRVRPDNARSTSLNTIEEGKLPPEVDE